MVLGNNFAHAHRSVYTILIHQPIKHQNKQKHIYMCEYAMHAHTHIHTYIYNFTDTNKLLTYTIIYTSITTHRNTTINHTKAPFIVKTITMVEKQK